MAPAVGDAKRSWTEKTYIDDSVREQYVCICIVVDLHIPVGVGLYGITWLGGHHN